MVAYDAIVLGAGGVGSAALCHLAQRGAKVLGLDQFDVPHAHGSSHGQTRIIRQAYFERPDYTPLLLETYRLWNALAEQVNRQLYHEVGVLQIGRAEGAVVAGVLGCAEEHNLAVERLSASEVERRWPAMRVPDGLIGAFEPRAGYLLVERCVEAHLQAAKSAGAELRYATEVESWQPGPPVTVLTNAGEFTADRLIVTAGAWAGPLLDDLQLGLEVRRKGVFWFAAQRDHLAEHEALPCFLYELPEGVFYGMPQIDQLGVKVAEHSGGQVIEDPLAVDRNLDPEDQRRVVAFARGQLPNLAVEKFEHAVCMYTMSRDQDFVVDRHPEHRHIAFAAGLSGHGFKFAPVLGKALAELVLDGETALPIDFLTLR